MQENTFINQLKKYKEDLELDVIPETGYQMDEYRYILGPEQKQMIMDEEQKHPYDIFKYYFLKSHDVEDDRRIMQSCFDDRWEIHPGVYRLKIVCGDNTYMNEFKDKEFMQKVIDSINNIKEDLELEYPDDKGELITSSWGNVYALGIKEKLALIDLMRELGFDAEFKHDYDYRYTPDTLENHIYARWILGGPLGYFEGEKLIQLTVLDKYDSYFAFIDVPFDYFKKFILDYADIDELIANLTFKAEKKVDEDLELDVLDTNTPEYIAGALADRIGDCIVDGTVIYQMMEDFEIFADVPGDTDEVVNIPYGIFAVYEVLPDGGVVAWNSKVDTCRDVDNIGHKPLDYYKGSRITACNTLREFIDYLDYEFGRDWFGTQEEIDDFLRMCEDLDLDVVEDNIYDRILYNGDSFELGDRAKDVISTILCMEDEEWEKLKDKTWIVTKDTPDIDAWYDYSADDDFPFALLIDDRLYDVLTPGCVKEVLDYE